MVIALRLADFCNSQRDHLVLMEPIPASALNPEIVRRLKTVHISLDGKDLPLVDGAVDLSYESEGGLLTRAIALSREPGATSLVEIGISSYETFPVFRKISGDAPIALPDLKGEGHLEGWLTTIPAGSIFQAKQISSQANAAYIDVFLEILVSTHA